MITYDFPEDAESLRFDKQYDEFGDLSLLLTVLDMGEPRGAVLMNEREVEALVGYLLDVLTEAEQVRHELADDDYYAS